MAETTGVYRATGREREQWFAILDEWGAVGRPYREIADYLTGKHGLSKWWAQKLVVEYEQERGVRAPGVRRNGTFEVGASKTIGAPVDRVFDAFVDGRRRKSWLGPAKLTLEDYEPNRSARFAWNGGSSRVSVEFVRKGASKATVSVSHDRITGAQEAQATKAMWRERLAGLKTLLDP
ncbi:MAG TPA: hypothetical protein VIG64_12865 [Actinomycetota bacterium]|jgi:hypothetical protein